MSHKTIINLNSIKSEVEKINKNAKIIAVSKTFQIEQIGPLIKFGHKHFGENKVQEAVSKWTDIKKTNPEIQLHLIGKLQTNKIKYAVKLFDYIHSVDSMKVAKKISDEQQKNNKKVKIFIQVNIGNEHQKSGINVNHIDDIILYCRELKLNVLGLMCIPPISTDPTYYFKNINDLNIRYGFNDLSMGMSSDYLLAAKFNATYLRIGSNIFGERI